MLHIFAPVEPAGQESFIPNVHSCEHTEWPSMSNELVQTWLAHSVDVSLAVVHVAPNSRVPPELESSVQAPSRNEKARRNRRIRSTLHRIRARSPRRGAPAAAVTCVLHRPPFRRDRGGTCPRGGAISPSDRAPISS